MKIAVSSDGHGPLIDFLLEDLARRGHSVDYSGPGPGEEDQDWPEVTAKAARAVSEGTADEGIVVCWTGTGASIAANKVPGIRAALCADGETARGARVWNHANVLALSLRSTTPAIAGEILDRWFETAYSDDDWNRTQIERVQKMDARQ